MKYILVSACLLGVNCRYDGKNNRCEAVRALLSREDICLIPVCPEQLGGLSTPRDPSERLENSVVSCQGRDVTENFQKGAREALRVAKEYHCEYAILKERSPSCGCGRIYDGTFSHTLVDGDGVTAQLLKEAGLTVFGDSSVK